MKNSNGSTKKETQATPKPPKQITYTCLRCLVDGKPYQWHPRRAQNEHLGRKLPARCPHCSSPLWNTPRVNKPRSIKPACLK